ncbi:MAG TPA: 5-bromo-4-chloroindolyl phosphate hydrolysis family protein [Candidatus Ventricola gallistercoris]|nr:5-bromo-4-chloroindolyl phosphate hydrolysis family protein [Candidatus Ventricola gallistercoris]
MEKRTIRSGAPFGMAGAFVLVYAAAFGIGTAVSYALAAALGVAGWLVGRRLFPDQVVEVERAPRSGSAEVDALIQEARAQLAEIGKANEAIADPQLSAQIDDIGETCRQILLRLEEQPGMLGQLRTFLRYYLPATLKLLQARARLEGEITGGQSAQIAARIAQAMEAVQSAFHKQLEALNAYRFINLESEMDVLSDMLRSDGLSADSPAGADEEWAGGQGQAAQEDPFAGLFTKGEGK